jgi:uncharacterized membrane protein
MMINNIDEYLDLLKKNLVGCDSATVQDALSDAEEYLRNGLETARMYNPNVDETDALTPIIDEFGSPEEFAAEYKNIEARVRPTFASPTRNNQNRTIASKIFGVFADPAAWGSLVFMLVSLVTGIIYFTWAVTGLSLSVGLLVLIISLPFIGLFFLSVRGIGLVEGRIVEALLGVRMPRRPVFVDTKIGWWGRFKVLFTSKHTWLTMAYMILMLPLGFIYFSVFIILISLALIFIAAPFAQLFFSFPLVTIITTKYYISPQLGFFFVIIGLAIAIGTLHLARLVGRFHGSLAKAMLVSE